MKPNQLRVTINEAQRNFSKLLEAVTSNRQIIIIKRRGDADVALIAADELSALTETLHLFKSPRNAARLFTALRRIERR